MRRTRLLAAALVFLSASALAAAETTPPPLSDAQVVKALEPLLGTEWHGVYFLGGKIGWMKSTASKSAGGQEYVLASTFHARINTLGVQQVMEVRETRTYAGPGWRLTHIEMTQKVGARTTRMIGRAKESGFEFTQILGGQPAVRMMPLPVESLAHALRAQLMALDPESKPGTAVPFRQFEATTGQEYHCTATLRGREKRTLEGVETTVVVVDTHIKEMDLASTTTLTSDGQMLESSVDAMIKVRLESEAVAKRLDVTVDPLAMGAIRLRRELPDVKRLTEVVLLMRGLDEERSRIQSDRQAYEPTTAKGEYRLTLKPARWPTEGDAPQPYDAAKLKAAASPTPFVQSDVPQIVSLAKQIVGQETDPRKRVTAIVHWVYGNIRKRYTAALSSALDVLQTRSGDCTEHTILFVALCRAAGIPTEQITGVVYGQRFGGFVYHAWARVYVGNRWVEVDPTFDEPTANAGHIAFAIGPLEKQMVIVSLVGQVKARYVSHKLR